MSDRTSEIFDRLTVGAAMRLASEIVYPIALPIGPNGEKVRKSCRFNALCGRSLLESSIVALGKARIDREKTDEENLREWEEDLRPLYRKIVAACSVAPRFEESTDPAPGFASLTWLMDEELVMLVELLKKRVDSRLVAIDETVDLSPEEWDRQFQAIGEVYLICSKLHIPLISASWDRATPDETAFARAVFEVGIAYERMLEERAKTEAGGRG